MTYTILSFCGGGIRGYLSACMLQNLWSQAGRSDNPNADLLAGCSAGSGIVSSIAAGKTTTQIVDGFVGSKGTYTGAEASYFSRQSMDPRRPGYDVRIPLDAQIATWTDPQDLKKSNPRLSELSQSVLFTAFNTGSQTEPWTPALLTNVKNADGSTPIGTDDSVRIAQAVMGSGAMPGQLGSVDGMVDGGFVSHDPTMAAVALAVAAGNSLADIYVIGFGTGLMQQWIASDTATWGAEQWQNGDGNPNSNTPPMLVNGTTAPVINMLFNGPTTDLTPNQCQWLLGGNYVYLNAPLDRFIPENDVNPVDLEYLQSQALTAVPNYDDAVALLKNWA